MCYNVKTDLGGLLNNQALSLVETDPTGQGQPTLQRFEQLTNKNLPVVAVSSISASASSEEPLTD